MQILKKITSIMLVCVLVLSMLSVCAFADESDNTQNIPGESVVPLSGAAAERLHALGIITDTDIANGGERPATRGEFAAWAVRLLGMEPDYGARIYSDVSEDTEYAAYINTACRLNLVSAAQNFNPGSQISFAEACKILLAAIGYGEVAADAGGWPTGYTTTAAKVGIAKGVNTSGAISAGDAVLMTDNTLDAKVLDPDYNGGYSRSDRTVLSEYLRIDKIPAKIDEVLVTDRQIRATSDGASNLYNLADSLDAAIIVEDEADLYVTTDRGNKRVVYIDYKGTVTVEYDYISEVNESADGNRYQTKDINKIKLTNSGKEYRMDSEAKVTLNDADARVTPVILTDAFAKVVVNSGRVVRIDAYSLYEGGIIYHSDPEMIKFIRGDVNNNVMQKLDTVDDMRIYLDGVRVDSMYRLKTDMLFDYYISADEEKMIFVASSRVFTKTMDSAGNGYVKLDGVKYSISQNTGLYVYSNSRERYQKDGSLSSYLGKKVTAFVDDNMYLRYVKVSDDIEYSDSFVGVLMAVSKAIDPFSDNGRLKIFKVTGGKVEKEYDIDETKMEKSPIKMDYLRAYAGDTYGRSFLRFTTNKQNRVVKVEPVDLWGSTTTFSGSISKTVDSWLGNLYCRTATMFAVYTDHNGKCAVRMLDWESDMRDHAFTSPVTIISDYDTMYNPKPTFIMLGEGSQSHRSNSSQDGILMDISEVEDDKIQLNFSNKWGTKKYTVTKDFVERNNLKNNLLVEWYYDLFGENPISIRSTRDLSGDPDTWSTDNASYNSMSSEGFYRADGILYRDEYCAQFSVNGEPSDLIPLNEYYLVYEIVHGKDGMQIVENKRKVPLGYISPGDKVWFHVVPWGPSPRSIYTVIYEKTSIAGN